MPQHAVAERLLTPVAFRGTQEGQVFLKEEGLWVVGFDLFLNELHLLEGSLAFISGLVSISKYCTYLQEQEVSLFHHSLRLHCLLSQSGNHLL